jgi:hypothetical protein
MIFKKHWRGKNGFTKYVGYFLFGIFPLFIERIDPNA